MANIAPDPADPLAPDTVATPEGDNEFAPDQPLKPVEGRETPRGNKPIPYDYDTDKEPGERSELESVLETIDAVSRGKIQP